MNGRKCNGRDLHGETQFGEEGSPGVRVSCEEELTADLSINDHNEVESVGEQRHFKQGSLQEAHR